MNSSLDPASAAAAPRYDPSNPGPRVAIAIELDQCVPWHQDCCEGILRYGQSKGWSCVIDPFALGPEGQQDVLVYDGVVGRIDSDVARAVQAQGIPIVNHWDNSPARELPSVTLDLKADGRTAGEHLIACGYKQLAYYGLLGDATNQLRIDGMCQAAADAGQTPPVVRLVDVEQYWSNQRQWHKTFLQKTAQWLSGLRAPVGLLVGESTIARYIAQFAPQWGMKVPNDLGLVVWNDDMSTNAISPTISVIDHDWFDVGYQSAAMLDELMQGKEAHPLHRLVPPTRLIARDTTDVFICEDELVKEAMRYIAEHCREELNVESIAEALNTSRRTLYRKFDQVLGRSIKEEIKRLRVDRLKLMLEETDLPLSELSASYGFSSPGQFSRFFAKATGQTPSSYRQRFKADQAR